MLIVPPVVLVVVVTRFVLKMELVVATTVVSRLLLRIRIEQRFVGRTKKSPAVWVTLIVLTLVPVGGDPAGENGAAEGEMTLTTVCVLKLLVKMLPKLWTKNSVMTGVIFVTTFTCRKPAGANGAVVTTREMLVLNTTSK